MTQMYTGPFHPFLTSQVKKEFRSYTASIIRKGPIQSPLKGTSGGSKSFLYWTLSRLKHSIAVQRLLHFKIPEIKSGSNLTASKAKG